MLDVSKAVQQQNRLYNKGFHFSYPCSILTHLEIFSSVPLLQKKHVKIKLGEMILQRIQVQPPAVTGTGGTRHDPNCHMERTESINHLHSLRTVNLSHPSWPPTNLFCKASYPGSNLIWVSQGTAIPACINSYLWKSNLILLLLVVLCRQISSQTNSKPGKKAQEVKIMVKFLMPIAEVKNISVCHRITDWCQQNLQLTILETFTGLNVQHNDFIYALNRTF